MSETKQIGNENSELNQQPTLQQVDDLAAELCTQFDNHQYFKWYCKAIWILGIPRMKELQGRVRDAKLPGRLFTIYLKDELKRHSSNQRMRDIFNGKEENKSLS